MALNYGNVCADALIKEDGQIVGLDLELESLLDTWRVFKNDYIHQLTIAETKSTAIIAIYATGELVNETKGRSGSISEMAATVGGLGDRSWKAVQFRNLNYRWEGLRNPFDTDSSSIEVDSPLQIARALRNVIKTVRPTCDRMIFVGHNINFILKLLAEECEFCLPPDVGKIDVLLFSQIVNKSSDEVSITNLYEKMVLGLTRCSVPRRPSRPDIIDNARQKSGYVMSIFQNLAQRMFTDDGLPVPDWKQVASFWRWDLPLATPSTSFGSREAYHSDGELIAEDPAVRNPCSPSPQLSSPAADQSEEFGWTDAAFPDHPPTTSDLQASSGTSAVQSHSRGIKRVADESHNPEESQTKRPKNDDKKMEVLWNAPPMKIGAMSIERGDMLELLRTEESSDWVLTRKGNQMGWVPGHFIRLLRGRSAGIDTRGTASNTWDFAPSGKGRADMTEAEIRAARLARFQE